MSVHYKFKSTLDYDTITFDGLHISVSDLKKAILQQKRLSKITDFDLQIINAQTKEEYPHDSSLIPKNTSLIISRVPLTNQAKKLWDASNNKPVQPRITPKPPVEQADFDLSKMEGSEEDKIQAMMMQSTAEYDPKSYQKIRGYSQTGEVPPTYRCNKCKKGGHWIKNCPFNISKEHTEVKRTTGIPKSFRDKDDRALMIESQEPLVEEEKKQEIPEDLVCGICNDLFVDAVMIPCCGSSFCDDCVRTALLESEENECPDCKEKGSSPGSLIPNRFLRNSVNAFKNRTGYKACSQAKKESKKEVQPTSSEPEDDKQTEVQTTKLEAKEEAEPSDDVDKENEEKSGETDTKTETNKVEKVEETPLSSDAKPEKEHVTTSHISPAHDDSDFEDNIVVKVPSALDTRTEKFLGRRHASHPKPPGMEPNSPKSKQQSHTQEANSHRSNERPGLNNNKDWDHSPRDHDNANSDHYTYEKNRSMSSKPPLLDNVQPPGASSGPVPLYPPHQSYEMQQRPIRPMNMHPGFHNHMHRPPLYPPHPNMPPHHQQVGPPLRMPIAAMNSYEQAYNPIGNVVPGYQRFPSSNMTNRFNYPVREVESQNQMRPFNNIASVYEVVAAKVGVGIIDDPLEAFNRIMKEKEKKKDDRRSPDRRRRSKERHVRGNFRTSPYNNRNSKDHGGGYHEKRGRSRERDNDRRWPRYEKPGDKDRDRDRERERERDRVKDHVYRNRRSKSLERNSRSRTHSPLNKRYRSPQHNIKNHGTQDKYPHHYHQKLRPDDHEESLHSNRHKREGSRGRGNISKPLDSRGGNKLVDHEERMAADIRKHYSLNDENSEPPPPGFEIQTSRNPFHSNIITSPPPNLREIRCQRNVTPDLYEKCVSQDLEENKMYNTSNRSDLRSRTRTRSRSHSRSSARTSDKRRKMQRSTTPKGKPSEYHHKKDKDKGSSYSSHNKHKADDRYSQKEKDKDEHDMDTKRRSMTPPREKESLKEANEHAKTVSDSHQTSSEEKSEKKSDKKLKDRKKKRKDKSERKKIKKEKKAKKERHRQKSEEKYTITKPEEHEDHEEEAQLEPEAANTSLEELKSDKEFQLYDDLEEEGEYHSVEKELHPNSTPIREECFPRKVITPKQEQQSLEYGEKTPPSDIKCFDAVLDIHEYETDFDDNSFKLQDNTNKLVPEASKWELDDNINTLGHATDDKIDDGVSQNNGADCKVTNDVIVRAEKAIFARAINAIRPIELRKKSLSKERSSKSYPDEHDNIRSNIKITLPVNISQERSVEVKNEMSAEKKKSIKDRLGSKVNQPAYSHFDDARRDDHGHKSSNYSTSTDRRDTDRHNRGGGGAVGIDSKVMGKRIENDKSSRERGDRERDRERRDRDRDRDRERERERDKDKEKEKEREKERERAKEKDRMRQREKVDIGRDNRDRERERERNHDYDKDRNKDHKNKDKSEKEHHRESESASRKRRQSHPSPVVVQRKRSPSSSDSESDDGGVERKRKQVKTDKKSRKRSETPDSDSKKSSKKKTKSDKKKKKKSKK